MENLGTGDPIVRTAADATALGMAFQVESRADGSRRFTFVGQRCLALNGVRRSAVLADARVLYDMILPEHRAAFAAAEAAALEKLQAFDVEVAMRRPDGEVRWHRIASTPRPQADGIVLWDGLQIDVTERRRMAAALAEQRHRLEMAVEATGLGFWEWDVESGTVTWSERNRQLFGLGPDDPIDVQRYMALVHPDDADAVRAAFAAARDKPHGGDYSIEHRVTLPNGQLRWLVSNGRVIAEGGQARLVVGTTLDVTERRATEERDALLLGELAHRAKNGIAVIMAIVAQTARGQETVAGYQDLLMARLQAMAMAQDLATATGGHPVALVEVITKSIAAFGPSRFQIAETLADQLLPSDMAVGLGLLLYELATNATKYGALSNNRGHVALGPAPATAGRAAFDWREIGGPPAPEPRGSGFGTRVLAQALRPRGGEVRYAFEPAGFRATIEFPVVR